ncbi:hypothetical protein BKA56DRAFT_613576 [Ilyonectria sp. MPI-CAGE-AT-0026]|nr:hypothetical protein BKA56DRAFT_613576 [Ilyonectria sp. MPI-CAGE-AT-0026]
MAESHQLQPLFGGNTSRYQRARRHSSSSPSSAGGLPDMIQFPGSVLDYHAQETADDSNSSTTTEHTQPKPTLEPNDPHESVNSTLLNMPPDTKNEDANREQSLPLMLLYSKRNDGLFESSPNFVYVWRFSPTALLTTIIIFWSRIESQTLRYIPWIAIQNGQSLGPDGYSLNYTSMLAPTVLIRSLQRKHFFVFLISAASMILKAQIVLAPSLFQLQTTRSSHPVEVQVLDSFTMTEDASQTIGSGAYHNAGALQYFDMNLPFGVSKEGAYQTFKLAKPGPGATSRGTVNAPLTVVVDAVFMDIQCHALENYTTTATPAGYETFYIFTTDLQFENCEHSINIESYIAANATGEWKIENDLENEHPCSLLPKRHPSFLYFAGYVQPSTQDPSVPHLETCATLVCSPIAWISKAEIVDDGINPQMTMLTNQHNTTIDSNPWTMLQASILGGLVSHGVSRPVHGPVEAAFQLNHMDTSLGDKTSYQNKVLRQAITNITQQIGPMLSHYDLRQVNESQIMGSIVRETYKLHVSDLTCSLVTGLFLLLLGISFWALAQSRRAPCVWYRDPATVLGNMIFFHSNTDPATDLMESLSEQREMRKTEWVQSSYSPLALRTWVRALFVIFALGLIVGFVIALDISERSQGLATINEEGYLLLLWTSLPTLAMLSVSLYISSTDTAIRDLSTLSSLSLRSCNSRDLDISLSDMIGFRALYHSIKLKVYSVTLSQLLATICGFLTTIAAVLFTTELAPETTSIQFQQESWFGSRPGQTNSDDQLATRQDLSSLLLVWRLSNLTYPQHTHADLLFPALSINDTDWNANTSIQVRIPAAKIQPKCVQLSDADFETSIGNTSEGTPAVVIRQSFTCPNGSIKSVNTNYISLYESTGKDDATEENELPYIAEILPSEDNWLTGDGSCGDTFSGYSFPPTSRVQTYAWGKFSFSTMDFDHFSVWRCNYSWAEVTADVKLIWTNETILIDHQSPPIQDNSTIRPWNPPFNFPGFPEYPAESPVYPEFTAKDPLASRFPTQFGLLIEPFGPSQLSNFGESAYDNQILDALHSNLGFLAAQLANIEQRLGIHEKSSTAPSYHGDLLPINATIADNGRLRLIQSPIPSFILVGILSLIVIVNLYALVSTAVRHLSSGRRSWLLDMDLKGLAPDGFNSIAMIESLVYDSNALKDVPEDAHLMSLGDLHESLVERRFRIGWFQGDETQAEVFTIGMLNDENFVYKRKKEGVNDD